MRCHSVNNKTNSRPLWRRLINGRPEWQANDYQRWRDCHEGTLLPLETFLFSILHYLALVSLALGFTPVLVVYTDIFLFLALRYSPPRRAYPRRHCTIARCRGWRRDHLRRCPGWRDSKGSQGACGTRGQFSDHHQGSPEGVLHGCQQDQGDCYQHERGESEGDAWQARGYRHDEQTDQAQYRFLH